MRYFLILFAAIFSCVLSTATAQLVETKKEEATKRGGTLVVIEVKRGDTLVYRQTRLTTPDGLSDGIRDHFFISGILACDFLTQKGKSIFHSVGLEKVSIYHRKEDGKKEILTLVDTGRDLVQSFLKEGDRFIALERVEDSDEERANQTTTANDLHTD